MQDKILNLNDLSKRINANSKSKGFWDEGLQNIPEKMMLIVSELSEALEALRKDKKYINELDNKDVIQMLKSSDTPDKMQKEYFESNIKDTFEDEIADTLIRLLDLCGYMDIDIDFHTEAKMLYNKGRERLHGKKF